MKLSYWNRQFQFSKILPDFQDRLAQMQARSEAVQDHLRLDRAVYGSHARQWVEVSGSPEAKEILPVFIHGGYWRALEAERHRFVLPALRSLTGSVANIEYRLMPEVRLKDIVKDACMALQHLSEKTGCRVLPIGHSAGGHLAVTCAGLLQDNVVGAVSISGLYELAPLQWSFLREEVGLTFADIKDHAPQDLWAERSAERVIVAVGEAETNEFHRQAQMFASSHGARDLTVPHAHHMTVLDDLATVNGTLVPAIAELLREVEE